MNRISQGVFSACTEKRFPEVSDSKNANTKGNHSNWLLFILNTLLISNEKSLIFILLMTTITAFAVSRKKYININQKQDDIPPDLKFYVQWVLKFLIPLQKVISARTRQQDTYPTAISGRPIRAGFRTRTLFSLKPSAGFFMCYKS
ncbi:MAG: hypothetical protein ABIH89_09220 [Elusimicrobiota bacterium]